MRRVIDKGARIFGASTIKLRVQRRYHGGKTFTSRAAPVPKFWGISKQPENENVTMFKNLSREIGHRTVVTRPGGDWMYYMSESDRKAYTGRYNEGKKWVEEISRVDLVEQTTDKKAEASFVSPVSERELQRLRENWYTYYTLRSKHGGAWKKLIADEKLSSEAITVQEIERKDPVSTVSKKVELYLSSDLGKKVKEAIVSSANTMRRLAKAGGGSISLIKCTNRPEDGSFPPVMCKHFLSVVKDVGGLKVSYEERDDGKEVPLWESGTIEVIWHPPRVRDSGK